MSEFHPATALLRLVITLLVLTVPSIARAQMDAGSLRALIADQFNGFTTDLRAEAFNLLNTVNFSNPTGAALTFGSATFGQITSAGDPRIIQLAVRFGF